MTDNKLADALRDIQQYLQMTAPSPDCGHLLQITVDALAAHDAPDECFCDRMYPDSNPNASCGDCPTRDYGAQPAPAPVQVDGAGELPPLPAAEYRVSPDSRQPSLYDEDAMRAYARAAIAARLTQQPAAPVPDMADRLKDPEFVYANMLRGVIVRPTMRQLVALHGEVPNGEDVQLARIAELQSQLAQALASRVQVPDAKHWLAAIVELYGSEAEDLTMLEQRARELAQEGSDGRAMPNLQARRPGGGR